MVKKKPGQPEQSATVLNFLRNHVLCTISTVNNESLQPESALIAFAELDTLEIIFITLEGSRKYVNLLRNNKVALVIGWDPNPKNWVTLQYEGEAYAIPEEDYPKYRNLFSKKENTPCTEEFLMNPAMKFFKIKPTWIGYSDSTANKPYVIEMKDF